MSLSLMAAPSDGDPVMGSPLITNSGFLVSTGDEQTSEDEAEDRPIGASSPPGMAVPIEISPDVPTQEPIEITPDVPTQEPTQQRPIEITPTDTSDSAAAPNKTKTGTQSNTTGAAGAIGKIHRQRYQAVNVNINGVVKNLLVPMEEGPDVVKTPDSGPAEDAVPCLSVSGAPRQPAPARVVGPGGDAVPRNPPLPRMPAPGQIMVVNTTKSDKTSEALRVMILPSNRPSQTNFSTTSARTVNTNGQEELRIMVLPGPNVPLTQSTTTTASKPHVITTYANKVCARTVVSSKNVSAPGNLSAPRVSAVSNASIGNLPSVMTAISSTTPPQIRNTTPMKPGPNLPLTKPITTTVRKPNVITTFANKVGARTVVSSKNVSAPGNLSAPRVSAVNNAAIGNLPSVMTATSMTSPTRTRTTTPSTLSTRVGSPTGPRLVSQLLQEKRLAQAASSGSTTPVELPPKPQLISQIIQQKRVGQPIAPVRAAVPNSVRVVTPESIQARSGQPRTVLTTSQIRPVNVQPTPAGVSSTSPIRAVNRQPILAGVLATSQIRPVNGQPTRAGVLATSQIRPVNGQPTRAGVLATSQIRPVNGQPTRAGVLATSQIRPVNGQPTRAGVLATSQIRPVNGQPLPAGVRIISPTGPAVIKTNEKMTPRTAPFVINKGGVQYIPVTSKENTIILVPIVSSNSRPVSGGTSVTSAPCTVLNSTGTVVSSQVSPSLGSTSLSTIEDEESGAIIQTRGVGDNIVVIQPEGAAPSRSEQNEDMKTSENLKDVSAHDQVFCVSEGSTPVVSPVQQVCDSASAHSKEDITTVEVPPDSSSSNQMEDALTTLSETGDTPIPCRSPIIIGEEVDTSDSGLSSSDYDIPSMQFQSDPSNSTPDRSKDGETTNTNSHSSGEDAEKVEHGQSNTSCDDEIQAMAASGREVGVDEAGPSLPTGGEGEDSEKQLTITSQTGPDAAVIADDGEQCAMSDRTGSDLESLGEESREVLPPQCLPTDGENHSGDEEEDEVGNGTAGNDSPRNEESAIKTDESERVQGSRGSSEVEDSADKGSDEEENYEILAEWEEDPVEQPQDERKVKEDDDDSFSLSSSDCSWSDSEDDEISFRIHDAALAEEIRNANSHLNGTSGERLPYAIHESMTNESIKPILPVANEDNDVENDSDDTNHEVPSSGKDDDAAKVGDNNIQRADKADDASDEEGLSQSVAEIIDGSSKDVTAATTVISEMTPTGITFTIIDTSEASPAVTNTTNAADVSRPTIQKDCPDLEASVINISPLEDDSEFQDEFDESGSVDHNVTDSPEPESSPSVPREVVSDRDLATDMSPPILEKIDNVPHSPPPMTKPPCLIHETSVTVKTEVKTEADVALLKRREYRNKVRNNKLRRKCFPIKKWKQYYAEFFRTAILCSRLDLKGKTSVDSSTFVVPELPADFTAQYRFRLPCKVKEEPTDKKSRKKFRSMKAKAENRKARDSGNNTPQSTRPPLAPRFAFIVNRPSGPNSGQRGSSLPLIRPKSPQAVTSLPAASPKISLDPANASQGPGKFLLVRTSTGTFLVQKPENATGMLLKTSTGYVNFTNIGLSSTSSSQGNASVVSKVMNPKPQVQTVSKPAAQSIPSSSAAPMTVVNISSPPTLRPKLLSLLTTAVTTSVTVASSGSIMAPRIISSTSLREPIPGIQKIRVVSPNTRQMPTNSRHPNPVLSSAQVPRVIAPRGSIANVSGLLTASPQRTHILLPAPGAPRMAEGQTFMRQASPLGPQIIRVHQARLATTGVHAQRPQSIGLSGPIVIQPAAASNNAKPVTVVSPKDIKPMPIVSPEAVVIKSRPLPHISSTPPIVLQRTRGKDNQGGFVFVTMTTTSTTSASTMPVVVVAPSSSKQTSTTLTTAASPVVTSQNPTAPSSTASSRNPTSSTSASITRVTAKKRKKEPPVVIKPEPVDDDYEKTIAVSVSDPDPDPESVPPAPKAAKTVSAAKSRIEALKASLKEKQAELDRVRKERMERKAGVEKLLAE